MYRSLANVPEHQHTWERRIVRILLDLLTGIKNVKNVRHIDPTALHTLPGVPSEEDATADHDVEYTLSTGPFR